MSQRVKDLPLSFGLSILLLALLVLPGCDSMSVKEDDTIDRRTQQSLSDLKLRHPQLLSLAHRNKADSTAGKYGSGVTDLILGLNLYEADGVTPRILNRYGITRRLLNRYGDNIRIKVSLDETVTMISVSVNDAILEEFLTETSHDEDILWVEPDAVIEFPELATTSGKSYDKQLIPWNIERVGAKPGSIWKEALAASAYTMTDPVHVYILDSGIISAPFIDDLWVVEKKDFTMLFLHQDQDLWNEDTSSVGVFDPDIAGMPEDDIGHGTHIAGTIGAMHNLHGIVGIAPSAMIHSLKVLDNGRTDITTLLTAIDYVVQAKTERPDLPTVVNLSLGMDLGTKEYNVLDEAIENAIQRGIIFVVSAGNDGRDASEFSPAHVKGAITVGSYDMEDRFSDFSNYGPAVDILAPGENIVSLTHLVDEAKAYESILASGTSYATPHVTGAIVKYLGKHPHASPAEVKEALLKNASPGISGAPRGTTDLSVSANW